MEIGMVHDVIKEDDRQEEIGARIRELREGLGLSARDLAKAIGVTVSAIKPIERGENIKQWMQLKALAGVLHATPNQLLGVDPLASQKERDEFSAALLEAFKGLLTDLGSEPWQAERLAAIALEAAQEKQIHDVDQRLAARTAAVVRLRQTGDTLRKPK